jgi:hypothetical protein
VTRPDGRPQIEARDFDIIVTGGGTFGAVLAEPHELGEARGFRLMRCSEGGSQQFDGD